MSTKLCEILPDPSAHFSFQRADNQPQFYHLGNAKWGPLPVRLMKLRRDWLHAAANQRWSSTLEMPHKIPGRRICKIPEVHVWKLQSSIKLVFLIKWATLQFVHEQPLLEFEPEPLQLKTIALFFADEGELQISTGFLGPFLSLESLSSKGITACSWRAYSIWEYGRSWEAPFSRRILE